jgi:hypothetical protein
MKAGAAPGAVQSAAAAPAPAALRWHLQGEVSEACSCRVPCTCNFGQSPSPESYCWALYSLDITKGKAGGVDLSGLKLASASGKNGSVFYVDERATPEQEQALRLISGQLHQKMIAYWASVAPDAITDPQFKLLDVRTAPITQTYGERSNLLKIGNAGLFQSDYIIGVDGRTPLMVENNWSWNITRNIKGKTSVLRYADEYGNRFDLDGTNMNQGHFDWTDATSIYYR